MYLVHLLAYSLVVASVKSVADSKNAVFLAKYEVGTLVVFLSYLSLDFLKLLPCSRGESGNVPQDALLRYALRHSRSCCGGRCKAILQVRA